MVTLARAGGLLDQATQASSESLGGLLATYTDKIGSAEVEIQRVVAAKEPCGDVSGLLEAISVFVAHLQDVEPAQASVVEELDRAVACACAAITLCKVRSYANPSRVGWWRSLPLSLSLRLCVCVFVCVCVGRFAESAATRSSARDSVDKNKTGAFAVCLLADNDGCS